MNPLLSFLVTYVGVAALFGAIPIATPGICLATRAAAAQPEALALAIVIKLLSRAI